MIPAFDKAKASLCIPNRSDGFKVNEEIGSDSFF